MGSIYKRGNVLWIKYYRNGAPIRESAETEKEKVAKDLLKKREGDVVRGVPVTPRTNRVTFDELAEDVLTDYKVNGKKSADQQERNLDHVLGMFRGWRAASITTADIRKYVAKRQDEKAANATINRELSALARAFSLGIDAGKVTHKPAIKKLNQEGSRPEEPQRPDRAGAAALAPGRLAHPAAQPGHPVGHEEERRAGAPGGQSHRHEGREGQLIDGRLPILLP
jgi:hypothetical protein